MVPITTFQSDITAGDQGGEPTAATSYDMLFDAAKLQAHFR